MKPNVVLYDDGQTGTDLQALSSVGYQITSDDELPSPLDSVNSLATNLKQLRRKKESCKSMKRQKTGNTRELSKRASFQRKSSKKVNMEPKEPGLKRMRTTMGLGPKRKKTIMTDFSEIKEHDKDNSTSDDFS